MKPQSGFTLVEMVAVIIILAIMAANAMPRFVNMTGDARVTSLNGLAASLNAAKTLARSKWSVANSATQANIDFGGTVISVMNYATTAPASDLSTMGYPSPAYSGIWLALDSPSGFVSTILGGASGVGFWPTGVANSGNCFLNYSNSGIVTVYISGNAPDSCT